MITMHDRKKHEFHVIKHLHKKFMSSHAINLEAN